MQLVRDDDTVEVYLHAKECHRDVHLATDELPACETGDDWVKIKRRLSKGDRDTITAAAVQFRMRVDGAGKMADQEIQFGPDEFTRMSIAGLVVGIKAWNLREDGKPVPLTVKNIQRLESFDAELIAERCNELWDPPRSDDEAKNSLTPLPMPSSMKPLHLANSAG